MLNNNEENCVRLILCEYEKDEYKDHPYCLKGTGFLIKHKEHIYFATAKHCVKDTSGEQVRVPIFPDSRNFLRFNREYFPINPENHDYKDIALYRVDTSTNNYYPSELVPYSLFKNVCAYPLDNHITQLITRGYPGSINDINYDNCIIKQQAVTITGNYDGRDETQKHIYKMKYDLPSGIESPDLMSGSPVFAIIQKGSKLETKFAGLIIRGGPTILRFIGSEVLLNAAEQANKRY